MDVEGLPGDGGRWKVRAAGQELAKKRMFVDCRSGEEKVAGRAGQIGVFEHMPHIPHPS